SKIYQLSATACVPTSALSFFLVAKGFWKSPTISKSYRLCVFAAARPSLIRAKLMERMFLQATKLPSTARVRLNTILCAADATCERVELFRFHLAAGQESEVWQCPNRGASKSRWQVYY